MKARIENGTNRLLSSIMLVAYKQKLGFYFIFYLYTVNYYIKERNENELFSFW